MHFGKKENCHNKFFFFFVFSLNFYITINEGTKKNNLHKSGRFIEMIDIQKMEKNDYINSKLIFTLQLKK